MVNPIVNYVNGCLYGAFREPDDYVDYNHLHNEVMAINDAFSYRVKSGDLATVSGYFHDPTTMNRIDSISEGVTYYQAKAAVVEVTNNYVQQCVDHFNKADTRITYMLNAVRNNIPLDPNSYPYNVDTPVTAASLGWLPFNHYSSALNSSNANSPLKTQAATPPIRIEATAASASLQNGGVLWQPQYSNNIWTQRLQQPRAVSTATTWQNSVGVNSWSLNNIYQPGNGFGHSVFVSSPQFYGYVR